MNPGANSSDGPVLMGRVEAMPEDQGLSDEQKNFLQGFAMGSDVARAVRGLPLLANAAANPGTLLAIGPLGSAFGPAPAPRSGPERLQLEAQDRVQAAGGTLSREEQAKRDKDPLTMYDEIQTNARLGRFPRDTDVFLYKYSGLFQVAPAQDGFMCRLRIPGGALRSWQFRGIGEIARRYGGSYVDVTTRANLQVREIGARDAALVLNQLAELGITPRGSGADNIRNVTASPTSGIDPHELIETLPLAKEMHHYILNHREMYGLPRKFNIAFDGGGKVSSLAETNDVGFHAVRVPDHAAGPEAAAGVYFRLALGGITGHKDFARDTGILIRPDECVAVAAAVVRVFIREGDRTNRKKARLKYVLDDWGFERFLSEVEKEYGSPLRRFDLDRCEAALPDDRWSHIGFHEQSQPGRHYLGVVLPVGRMTAEQVEGLAAIAERFGSGCIRLTVWQNLLISDIATADINAVKRAIEALGLDWDATGIRGGLVACTGNQGCKYAAADTKRNALAIARYLEERIELDQAINIHLTGCHHSCAQHYIGDIGLEATRVEAGEETVEGYHLCVGGGWGEGQGIGRRLADSVPFDEVPPMIERLLRHYLDRRGDRDQPFAAFVRERSLEELRSLLDSVPRSSELKLQTA